MAPLSLKIILDDGAVTRKVKFDSSNSVRQATEIVKEKVIVSDPGKEYALFLRSADNDLSGIWLDDSRNLEYYMLRDGDGLDYICKVRNLRVRMLDGAVKTLQVDQKKSIGSLMVDICTRIGITNYDEYGLCYEEVQEKEEKKEPTTGTLTLKRKIQHKERDPTLEELSKKLNTDDNVEWLDSHSTLRELGVEKDATVLLKRRLFFSDRNVNARDPVELNLLYVQTRDAIHNARHPVTEEQATDCKVRWINIRDVHRRILRKNLAQPIHLCKTYKYDKEMEFMKKYYKDVSLPTEYDETDETKDDEDHYQKSEPFDKDDEIAVANEDICSDESDQPKKKRKTKRKKVKKRKEELVEEVEMPDATSYIEPQILESDSADSVDAFLVSIGATLKTFSAYHLNLAKSKIFAVVQEHDLQQIVEKERLDSSDKISATETVFIG